MTWIWLRVLWLAWISAVAVGALSVALFATRGTWYEGLAIGSAVGMATWFPRPERRRSR